MGFEEQRAELVQRLERMGFIKGKAIKRAMLRVGREHFVDPKYLSDAYVDVPLPIPGGATISAPHMHAMFMSCVGLRRGKEFAEIGFGSGILLAYAYEVVGREGKVVGIEVIPETYEFGMRNLERTGYAGKVRTYLGDGSKGIPQEAPFDAMIVSAASPRIFDAWVEQLKPGGRLAVPVGEAYGMQELLLVNKSKKGRIRIERLGPVSFIPLIIPRK
jgi:protein-L-isoaspartate(D-aspartate) O-methyltransferase